MKRKKITLTEEDKKLGPQKLMEKYGLSSRGHSWYVLGKGYYWENYLSVSESFAPEWVEQNIKEIEKCALKWLRILAWRRGTASHKLFWVFRNDIIQDGIIYIIQRAGEIQSGSCFLNKCMEIGINNAMSKYFSHGEGKNNISSSFYSLEEKFAEELADEEENIDQIFDQVREEVISSLGQKAWSRLWSWATSRSGKCPEDVLNILKAIAL